MYRSPGRWTGTPYRTGCRVECLGDVESAHRGKVTYGIGSSRVVRGAVIGVKENA